MIICCDHCHLNSRMLSCRSAVFFDVTVLLKMLCRSLIALVELFVSAWLSGILKVLSDVFGLDWELVSLELFSEVFALNSDSFSVFRNSFAASEFCFLLILLADCLALELTNTTGTVLSCSRILGKSKKYRTTASRQWIKIAREIDSANGTGLLRFSIKNFKHLLSVWGLMLEHLMLCQL